MRIINQGEGVSDVEFGLCPAVWVTEVLSLSVFCLTVHLSVSREAPPVYYEINYYQNCVTSLLALYVGRSSTDIDPSVITCPPASFFGPHFLSFS